MLTVIEKVLLIQEMDFFSFAFTEHLAQVAGICKEIRVRPETIIFHENEPCRLLHILTSGHVILETDGQEIGTLRRGALDFWAFFSEDSHEFTCQALEESLVLTVSFEDMVDLLTAEPEFCWAITKQLARLGKGAHIIGGPAPAKVREDSI